MSLPPVKFTLRQMMVAVALVAAALWIGLLGWRSSQLLRLSRQYRYQAALYERGEQLYIEKVREIEDRDEKIASREKQASESTGAIRLWHQEYASALRDTNKLEKRRLSIEREWR